MRKVLLAIYSDNGLSLIMGIGLVLMSLMSSWFIFHSSYVTIFLPQWGFSMIAIVCGILWQSNRITKETLGPKVLWIPMLIMIGFVWITCLIHFSKDSLVQGLFISVMPVIYVSARILGKRVLWSLVISSVIESFSVIFYSIFFSNWDNWRSLTNGGLISDTNYALGNAFIAFGLVCGIYLIKGKWLYPFIAINTIGMLMTGSPEALIILGMLFVWFIFSRDWNREIVYSVGMSAIVIVCWFAIGAGTAQYHRVGEVVDFVTHGNIAQASSWNNVIHEPGELSWGQGRLPAYKRAIEDVSIFGHGYYVYQSQVMNGEIVRTAKVHNTPLVVLDQVGIVPFLCWIFLTLYCLIKFKWKALWIGVIGLGAFNHTTWTVFAPYWWLAIGITSAYAGKKYIFKEDNEISVHAAQ